MVPKKTVRRWAPPFLVATAIFVGSVLPAPSGMGDTGAGLFVPLDKMIHFGGYALLGATLAAATDEEEQSRASVAFWLVALVAVYGAGLEILQSYLPTRAFSIGDVLTNALGGVLGVGFIRFRESED